jgi:hypothetical protein
MTPPDLDWVKLYTEFPPDLVQKLRSYMETPGPLELTTDDLTAEAVTASPDSALTLLRRAVSLGVLSEERRFDCPNCSETLTASELKTGTCPHCNLDLTSTGAKPEEIFVFVRECAQSRDVRWVLALHGMNTAGAWQEEFNWLVSTSYAHAVPVAIYKYGIVRPGAFFRFRHLYLAQDLACKIKRLVGEAGETGFGYRPDVIAHSLGTLLLNVALRTDKSLEVGRVILLGSIIRPDSNWRDLIDRGQVQAVLNHYGTKDFWASIAHYLIPDSGPSGRVGFNDADGAINVAAQAFGHSDFFRPQYLQGLFVTIWRPFLTSPKKDLPTLNKSLENRQDWRQAWWPLRATLPRFVFVGAAVLVGLLLLFSFLVGLLQVFRWLRR